MFNGRISVKSLLHPETRQRFGVFFFVLPYPAACWRKKPRITSDKVDWFCFAINTIFWRSAAVIRTAINSTLPFSFFDPFFIVFFYRFVMLFNPTKVALNVFFYAVNFPQIVYKGCLTLRRYSVPFQSFARSLLPCLNTAAVCTKALPVVAIVVFIFAIFAYSKRVSFVGSCCVRAPADGLRYSAFFAVLRRFLVFAERYAVTVCVMA